MKRKIIILTEEQKQELIDKYDVDDIIAILEPDIEELISILEEYIVQNIDKFELDSYDYQENED